jgi:uncharacterized protein YjiS (DUF1127 family)
MIALLSLQNAPSGRFLTLGRALAAAARCPQRIFAIWRQVDEILRYRREAAMLATFNDRMLADIGLTRGDLHDAFAEPPWRDPTAILVVRASERRAARRGNVWPWPEPPSVSAPSIVPSTEQCDAGHPVAPS